MSVHLSQWNLKAKVTVSLWKVKLQQNYQVHMSRVITCEVDMIFWVLNQITFRSRSQCQGQMSYIQNNGALSMYLLCYVYHNIVIYPAFIMSMELAVFTVGPSGNDNTLTALWLRSKNSCVHFSVKNIEEYQFQLWWTILQMICSMATEKWYIA